MSSEINEETAIFIGCVIGIVVLILFGLLLCFCHKKKSLRIQHENAKYKRIHQEPKEYMDFDIETNGNTVQTSHTNESILIASDKKQEVMIDMNDDHNTESTHLLEIINSDAVGHYYHDTESFDDTLYFKEINVKRIHLNKIIYWKSNHVLIGIQCEYIYYDDEGQIIKSFKTQRHCRDNDNLKYIENEYSMEFANYWHHSITINTGNYIHCVSMASYDMDTKIFGAQHGIQNEIKIPTGHIVIGFHGGFGNYIHYLGVITMPYKESVGYDLIKRFLKTYSGILSDIIIGYILDFIFFVDNEESTDSIEWEHPRHDAKATCFPKSDYNDTEAIHDAQLLREAIKTNDDEILLNITTQRTNKQRVMMKEMYNAKDGDLLKDLDIEWLPLLYRDCGEFEARLMIDALANNKDLWMETICTLGNKEIECMKKAWNKIDTDSMVECITHGFNDGSDDLNVLMNRLLDAQRFGYREVSTEDICNYLDIINSRFSKTQLFEILSRWSWCYIGVLNAEYIKISHKSLCDLIEELFVDDVRLKDALCVIVEFSSDPYDFWALKIKDALKGTQTNEKVLMRCIMRRCEIDLFCIQNVFDKTCDDGISLRQWIENETSGIYQQLLLMLCGYKSNKAPDIDKQDTETRLFDLVLNEQMLIEEEDEEEDEEDEEEDEDDDIDESKDIEDEAIDIYYDLKEYKDIEAEHIESLLSMTLPKFEEKPITKWIGDRSKYKLCKKKKEYKALERDLRRIRLGLKDVDVDDRKYCKLVILKYYDILCATFKRYCLIGGDGYMHWLTKKGWKHFYHDGFVKCKDKDCDELFDLVCLEHCTSTHAMNRESDWNGIWKNEENGEIFKLKQMSDYRLKGFIDSFDFCDIDGLIKTKVKTKKFDIFYHEKKEKMKCSALLTDKNQIEIESSSKNGSFILHKIGELTEFDNDSFKSVYGLLRYEFFEAVLVLSQMKFAKSMTHKYKFQSLYKFIEDVIVQYIWDDIHSMDWNESKDAAKLLFKKHCDELHKVFTMYCTENEEKLSENGWNTLCQHLFDQAIVDDDGIFKKGGRATKMDIAQSFELATNQYITNLSYTEFEKALQKLAHKIYKGRPQTPRSTYVKVHYTDKLAKLVKWVVRLNTK